MPQLFKFRPFLPLTAGTAIAVLAAALLAACGETAVEDTRPGQPVKHRQAAFKEIVKAFEPMGVLLRKDRYDADKFIPMAENLAARRDGPWSYFGPDTNYPPSKATAEVWKQPEQFEKARQDFIAATDALLAATRSKDKAQVTTAYETLHETCKNCHKQFKER